jgi:hypothetical protein
LEGCSEISWLPVLAAGGILHVTDHKVRVVDWDRQSDADVSGVVAGGVDGGIDPDHLALPIEQWPTGVALVACRIRLDEIVERRELLVAIERADDTGSHRAFVAEGVSNCDDGITLAEFVAVADPLWLPDSVRTNLEHSDIESERLGNKICLKLVAASWALAPASRRAMRR